MDNEILNRLERIEKIVLSQKSVLTFDEVTLFTGLSKSHLYKLTSSQKIPHYKPTGKLLYFERSELEKWLLQNPVITADEIEQKAVDYCYTKGGAK